MKYVLNQFESEKEENMARAAIQEGMTLYGFCGSIFGRDSYGPKYITFIMDHTITVNEERYGKIVINTGEVRSWIDLLSSSNDWLRDNKHELERRDEER